MVKRQCKPVTIDGFCHWESVAMDFNREQTFKVACSHIKMEKVPK